MKALKITLFLAALVAFSACKKDDMDGTGQFKIEFEHSFGADGFVLNNTTFYTTASAEQVKFTMLKYYVSNIVLTKSDGTTWAQPESYYLIDMSNPATATLTVSDVPAGDYTSVSFMIGVDSTRNVSGAQTGALSTANGMFWSWNSGYIFFKAEGECPQASGSMFTYHVGGFSGADNALRTVNIDFAGAKAEVRKDAASQAHISVDVAQAFDASPALVIATNNMIHMPGADAVAMSSRYQNMFEFEHIHN
jgi:hypothetical protein